MRLYDAARKITDRIGEQPRSFPRVEEVYSGEVRRALVRRYQYWVIYEVLEARGECLILAFWSTRRYPQGWRSVR